MQNEVLKRKTDIIEFIMDCLRDQEVALEDKKECLKLLPFLGVDNECLKQLSQAHIEDVLVDFIKSPHSSETILSQILKSLIIMNASPLAFMPNS